MNSVSKALRKAKRQIDGRGSEPTPFGGAEVHPLRASTREDRLPSSRQEPAKPANEGANPTTAPASALDIRDYIYIGLKHRWLVLALLILIPAATAVYTSQQTPQYRSTAILLINRARVNIVEDLMVGESRRTEEFYGTHLRLLQSSAMARRVVDQLELWNHPYFGGPRKDNEPPENVDRYVDWVRRHVGASHLDGTELINASCWSPDPNLSATVANGLVQEYIAFTTAQESGAVRNAVTFLQEQVKKLQEEIKKQEASLGEYSASESQHSLTLQRLQDVNTRLSATEGERTAAKIRYERLLAADPADVPAIADDPDLLSLRRQHDELQKQHDELASKFKSNWPELQRVRSALEDSQKRLDEATQQALQNLINDARTEFEASQEQALALRGDLGQHYQETQRTNAERTEYQRVKLELEGRNLLLQELMRRQSEAGLTVELEERPPVNARIVEEAKPSRLPFAPSMRRNLFMALLAAMVLAIGLVLGIEYWNSAIDTVEDVRRHVPLTYLGMITRYGRSSGLGSARFGKKSERVGPYLVVQPDGDRSSDPDSRLVMERFKFLRTVLLSTVGSEMKTCLITSPGKQVGKTFVACNLASSLASIGKRILLVDGDLRIPKIHKIFGLENERGLSTLLAGVEPTNSADLVHDTTIPNLYVLTSGSDVASPAELLGARELEDVLGDLAGQFDMVIIDSAPVLPVPDSLSIAKRCDSVILIVRSGHTALRATEAAIDLCSRVGCRITGVVLNDVNLSDRAKSFYHSYQGYEYEAYGTHDDVHHSTKIFVP